MKKQPLPPDMRLWLYGLFAWALLWTSAAVAQEPPPALTPESLMGALEKLSDEQKGALAEACPQEDMAAIVACIQANPEALAVIVPLLGAAPPPVDMPPTSDPPPPTTDPPPVAAPPAGSLEDFPPEALVFPQEFLALLPSNIKRVLIGEDYTQVRAICPESELEALFACLDRPEVSEALDDLLAVRIIDNLLEVMDAEIPVQLQAEHYKFLVELCEAPADTWMECHLNVDYVVRPPLQEKLAAASAPEKEALQDEINALETVCDESEEVFASCLAENDPINELYIIIQDEKKEIFGKEIFIEFAGILSALTIEEIKALRGACDQKEPDAAKLCFKDHPAVKADLELTAMISALIVEEVAAELQEKGQDISAEKREALANRFTTLFLTLPPKSINSLYRACEKKDPALQELANEESVSLLLDCMDNEAQEDPIANPAYIARDKLLKWINIAEEKTLDKIREKAAASQAKSSTMITYILLIVAALGGFVLMLLPLKLRKQYPGKDAIIWRACGLAAGTFVVTIILLGISLLIMRGVQNSVAAEATNPQLRVAQGTFEILKREVTVENFSRLTRKGLDFVKTPLRKIAEQKAAIQSKLTQADPNAAEEDKSAFIAVLATHWADMLKEPEVKRLAQNAAMLKGQADTFKSIIGMYKKINWIMGYIPVILSLLAVVMFLLPLKQTLVDIIQAPSKIASGSADSNTVFQKSMTDVKNEGRSLLPFLGVLVVFIPLTGVFMSLALPTTIEVLLEYSVRTVFYLLGKDALASVLYASLGSAMLMLVLMLVIYILATVFFLGSTRKIMRIIYHENHTWAQHKPLWINGSLAIIGAMILPVVYSFGVEFIFNNMVRSEFKELSGSEMVLFPLMSALLFPIFFWAARGMKCFGYVKNYPLPFMPKPAAPPPASPPGA